MSSGYAIVSLWVVAALTVGLGAILFLSSDPGSYYQDDDELAMGVAGWGLLQIGFGVSVLTLAVHAIVGAVRESAKSS